MASSDIADPRAAPSHAILTPDQRPRVFVSSTLAEMAPERLAARRAIERLRLIPVMFELGARPHPARSLYRAYLAQSHVFLGLYAERGGWVAPGETISGLEDEYLLSGALPRLVYLKAPAPQRDARLTALIDRIRSDDTVSYKSFSDPDELERLLTDDLTILLSERFLLGGSTGASSTAASASTTSERGASAPVRPLPRPLGALIGREAEVREIERLLADGARLVTLVGPGGIGKTRAALEVAHRASLARPGDVVFVALDAVRDAAAVLPAVGTALGIGLDASLTAAEALGRVLRDRACLLILDNMEQVLDCAVAVRALLDECPKVAVLATSRAALRVRGEHQVAIGPLETPETTDARGDGFAAVRLFLERAREASNELTLDQPGDADAIAELTRRLEGIPLAIELAAARVRTLPPRALLSRVRSALDLRSGAVDLPARHRTLRDTVAWSEELLPAEQRSLLAKLAIFSAPWTLADAEAIAGAEVGDVLDAASGLVEHSLAHLHASASGEPRFRLYEVVRAYALPRLDAEGRARTEARFVARMADVVRELDRGIRSTAHPRWRSELRLVWPDVRAALELALTREDAAHVVPLSRVWTGMWLDGRAREVDDLVRRALELADREKPEGHEELVLSTAGLSFQLGDEPRARASLRRITSGELALPALPELRGTTELYLGLLAAGDAKPATAKEHVTAAVELLAGCGPGGQWIVSFAHSALGSLHALEGDVERSAREMELSRELGRRHGNVAAELQSSAFIAAMRLDVGDVAGASRLLTAAAEIVDSYPFYDGHAYCIEVAAAVALARGDGSLAAEALGVAEALREVAGARVWLAPVRARAAEEVRAALSEPEHALAIARGRRVDVTRIAGVLRRLVAPS